MTEAHRARRAFSDADWTRLIQSEFEEMPDLNLTPVQIQRLWGIGPHTCRVVIEALVAQKALQLTLFGSYARYRARN